MPLTDGLTDFANLILAVHTAIHIFSPGVNSREGGLYRYRYPIYVFWFGFAVLLASLAFVNPKIYGGYVSQSTHCFLPIRPFWYRLALSWIPRYIILSIICATYIAIYAYVMYRFRGIDRNFSVPSGTADLNTDGSCDFSNPDFSNRDSFVLGAGMIGGQEIRQRTMTLPDLQKHGLITESRHQSMVVTDLPSPELEKPKRASFTPKIEAARRRYLDEEEVSEDDASSLEHQNPEDSHDDRSSVGILHFLRHLIRQWAT